MHLLYKGVKEHVYLTLMHKSHTIPTDLGFRVNNHDDSVNPTIMAYVDYKRQKYHNVHKFSDRQVWANSADPDQTAPRAAVWSGSTLFAIPSASFGLITLW